jgi:hypothetical protein
LIPQDKSSERNWKTSDSSILQIGSSDGRAHGLKEGRVDVMLQNHINAASIVHVSKVQFAQFESKVPLVLNTDEQYSSLRVRMKLYLNKNGEEIMPTSQFDNVPLIRQNIGI